MDDSARSMMLASIHLSTMRWTMQSIRRLRAHAAQLGVEVDGVKIRGDMTDGKLIGKGPDLLFWYYPEGKGGGQLYLVQQCPVCRRPFPTEVQTRDEVAAFWDLPLPDCRPGTWTRAGVRHRLHARRAERQTR